MTDLVVKGSVPTPKGYAVATSAAAPFMDVLQAHGIRHEVLAAPREVKAQAVQLVRVETDFDSVYQRYEDRHIVRPGAETLVTLMPGTVWVPLDQALALAAVQLLEPGLMYGLYGYPAFRSLARPGQDLPVLRVF